LPEKQSKIEAPVLSGSEDEGKSILSSFEEEKETKAKKGQSDKSNIERFMKAGRLGPILTQIDATSAHG
jgi:hypothetical protein